MAGRLDRLDRGADGCVVVLDYKTGAAPSTKTFYPRDLQASIRSASFFQLRCYALLLDTDRSVRFFFSLNSSRVRAHAKSLSRCFS